MRNEIEMAGHTADVMCVDTCEDGEFIVSGDENEVAKIWTAVGQCLHTLKGHGGWINCCSIFERTVVTGSEDETLKVWDRHSGDCLHTLEGHEDTVNCCSIHDDTIVSGDEDCTLHVWSATTGKCLKSFKDHEEPVYCCAVLGQWMVSGGADRTVRLWDLCADACVRVWKGHTGSVYSCSISGNYVVSGSWDRDVKVWNIHLDEPQQSFKHTFPVKCCVISGSTIVSGTSEVGSINAWKIETNDQQSSSQEIPATSKIVPTVAVAHSAECICAVSGDLLVSASWDGTGKVWNVADMAEIAAPALAENKTVRVLGSEESSALVCHCHSKQVFCCAAHARSGTVLTGSADTTMKLWDKNGACLCTFGGGGALPQDEQRHGHSDWVHGCAISEWNGVLVMASASRDKTVKLWRCYKDSTEDTQIQAYCFLTLTGHERWVYCCAMSGVASDAASSRAGLANFPCTLTSRTVGVGGGLVISGSEDQMVRIWRITSIGGYEDDLPAHADKHKRSEFSCVHTLEGHSGGVHCCWLSPSGLTAVTGSGDNTIRVWDVWRGVCKRIFTHSDPVLSCGLSACGRWLYSCTMHQVHLCAWKRVDNVHVDDMGSRTAVVQHPASRLEQFSSLAMTEDGKLVYGTKEGRVYMGSIVIG